MTTRAIIPAVFAASLGLVTGAQAQTAATANGAVNTPPHNTTGAPIPGANSFTEGQARDRIQENGVTQVTDLKLDSQGVWRGKGTKNGQKVDVALDYQGNVVPQ